MAKALHAAVLFPRGHCRHAASATHQRKAFGFIVPAPGSKQAFLFGGIFLFKFCKHELSSPLFGLKPTWWVHVTGHGERPQSSAPAALPGAALKCP